MMTSSSPGLISKCLAQTLRHIRDVAGNLVARSAFRRVQHAVKVPCVVVVERVGDAGQNEHGVREKVSRLIRRYLDQELR